MPVSIKVETSTTSNQNFTDALYSTWIHCSKDSDYRIKTLCSNQSKISLELFKSDLLESFLHSSFVIVHLPSFALESDLHSPMNIGLKDVGELQRAFHGEMKDRWQASYGTYRYWSFLERIQKGLTASPICKMVDKIAIVSADHGGNFLTRENLDFVGSKGILLADPQEDLIDILEFSLPVEDPMIGNFFERYNGSMEMPPIYCLACSHGKQKTALRHFDGENVEELFAEFECVLEDVFE